MDKRKIQKGVHLLHKGGMPSERRAGSLMWRRQRTFPPHFSGADCIGPFFFFFLHGRTEGMKIYSFEEKGILKKVAQLIASGSVVIFPTDTVYGLLAAATNKRAVQKVFRIKKRPLRKPLSLFVRNIAAAKQLAVMNAKQEPYIKRHWPGSTTVVLERKNIKKPLYGVSQRTIALRQPDHTPLLSLLKKLPFPLTATSANVSDIPPVKTIEEAMRQFSRLRPDAAVDAGTLNGKPSTVIDLTKTPFRIVRS